MKNLDTNIAVAEHPRATSEILCSVYVTCDKNI